MGDVFDLDVLRREREQEPFRFRFGGEDFELPASPDVRAVAAWSAAAKDESRFEDALKALLGADQWGRLVAVVDVFDMESFQALMGAYGEFTGAAVGESQASSPSSNRAARRSKPTSPARTISA
jgi:hypothetical protein